MNGHLTMRSGGGEGSESDGIFCGERISRGGRGGEGAGGRGWRLSKELANNWQGIGGLGRDRSGGDKNINDTRTRTVTNL